MQPGLHDFTDEQYHADPCPSPSLSNSLIKILNGKSPKHAWMAHPKLNPNFKVRDDDKFDIGSAAHDMLLMPDSKICVIDAPDWRTKAAKEQREEAKLNGLLPLLAHQHHNTKKMVQTARDFISGSPLFCAAFTSGMKEKTLTWQISNMWCRAKLDVYDASENLIVDYKTTGASSPSVFMRSSIPDFGYDTQDEFYCLGIEKTKGRRPRFVFLVQEDTEPYACYIVENSPARLAIAENKIHRAINQFHLCLMRDSWPSYSDGSQVMIAEPAQWEINEAEGL